MKEIEAFLFDLGNVLVGFDHYIAAKRIARFTDFSAQEIYSLFFDSALTEEFEKGEISGHQFYLKVKQKLNLNLDYDGFVPIWRDIFFEYPEMSSVVRRLKALHYKLYLVSNVNELHFLQVKEKFPLIREFDRLFLSFQLKVRKPEVIIYQKVLEDTGIKPGKIFYTDDRPEFVEAASKLGLVGIQFKGAQQLKDEFSKFGIII